MVSRIEESPFGRIVVPERVPNGKALFYTTIDFDGRLDDAITTEISAFIAGRFGIESSLTTCTQVHGSTARKAAAQKAWRECDSCDALWTAEPHTALGIKVADCLPVTLIDAQNDVVANIHSGWRGAVQGITAVTLDTLERDTKFDARASMAFLGPTIRVCCFEVGEEVASQFDEQFVDRSYAKPHVDIAAMTTALLQKRGFAANNIVDLRRCTRCDDVGPALRRPGPTGESALRESGRPQFHSYRRGGKGGGRNLAIAAQ